MTDTKTFELEAANHARDAVFNSAIHGESARARAGLAAMISKKAGVHRAVVDTYFTRWNSKFSTTEASEQQSTRTEGYATTTNLYYDLVTDFFEHGWGKSFHFCRFTRGERFDQAIARHQYYLAHNIGIQEGMHVLDVGCGVGGPACEIATFTGARITGVNNSDYQIDRARCYAEANHQLGQLDFVKCDFMQLSFPENTFDAAYSIESTVHAPSLEDAYQQIFRVLKPGGIIGVYEWAMTDKFDADNPHHQEIRNGIEQGSGVINHMPTTSEAVSSMKAAGFELLRCEDLADAADPFPWYWVLSGRMNYVQTIADIFTVMRYSPWGLAAVHTLFGLLETLKIVPAGTKKTADNLSLAARCLALGGHEQLFTPMFLMIGRKPLQ